MAAKKPGTDALKSAMDAKNTTTTTTTTTTVAGTNQLDRFVEVPKDLLIKALLQPSVLHHLAVACTKCGRWVPFEITDHIPDVAPLRVPSNSVVLRDAVSADHLPGVLQRRSARLASRVVSQATGGATAAAGGHRQPPLAAATYYMPNPQCFTCNWSYCCDGDADFLELTETIITPSSSSTANVNGKRGTRSAAGGAEAETATTTGRRGNERRAIAAATAVAGDTSTRIPLVAQCCLCQKWRRVRRPHPSIIGFCCALSAYAESRSCAAPENIEWLSDIFLSSEKLRGILRRQRRPPRYMDPRHIRESRQLLHRQRVQSAPALFGGLASSSSASAIGKKRDDPIDVDRAEVIPVSRIAGATTTHAGEKEPHRHPSASSQRSQRRNTRTMEQPPEDVDAPKSGRGRQVKSERAVKKEPMTDDVAIAPKERRSSGGGRSRTSVKVEPREDEAPAAPHAAVADPSSFRSARLASRAQRLNEHNHLDDEVQEIHKPSHKATSSASKSSPHQRARQPVNRIVDIEEDDGTQAPVAKRSRNERRPSPSTSEDKHSPPAARSRSQQRRRVPIKSEPLSDSEAEAGHRGTTGRARGARGIEPASGSNAGQRSVRSGGRSRAKSTAHKTVWVQCGACEKWRVVRQLPNEEALSVWECSHRVDIPTCCDDPDETDLERNMLMRLGIV